MRARAGESPGSAEGIKDIAMFVANVGGENTMMVCPFKRYVEAAVDENIDMK